MIIKSIKYNSQKNAIIATCDGNFGRVHEEVVTKQVIQAMSEYLANLSIKTGEWLEIGKITLGCRDSETLANCPYCGAKMESDSK